MAKYDITTGNSPLTVSALTEGKFYGVTYSSNNRKGGMTVHMKDGNANLIPVADFQSNDAVNIPCLTGTELVLTLTGGSAQATCNITLAG